MKLPKAIEILDTDLRPLFAFLHEDYEAAFELGIEAMKALKYIRDAEHPVPPALLPGETGD